MDLLMHTADYPANERFDAWMDLVSRALVPVEVATADPVTYEGQMMATQFDRVGVASVTSSSCISHRTQRLINQADPNAVQLMLVTQGATGVTQNGTESTLRRGDVAIHTTWRPFTVHAVADGSGVVTGTTAVIPRDQIPLPTNAIEQLTAHAISGNEGSGALLAGLLVGLTKQPATPQSRGAWLACALTDVLTATLSAAVEHQAWLPPETVDGALLARIRVFIQQHLGDPALNPSMVAAANHVSTRTLHRLFENHGDTVAGFIRRRRLGRCQRDLSNPDLRHHPIQDIAARWGFRSPSHFNRRFQETTGMTPGQFRQNHLAKQDTVANTAGPRLHR